MDKDGKMEKGKYRQKFIPTRTKTKTMREKIRDANLANLKQRVNKASVVNSEQYTNSKTHRKKDAS